MRCIPVKFQNNIQPPILHQQLSEVIWLKGAKSQGGNKTQTSTKYFESRGEGSILRVFIERRHVFVQQEGSQVLLFHLSLSKMEMMIGQN